MEYLETTVTVTEEQTAQSMGSGDLPVLATPAMIALMENAAMRYAANLIPEGCTTVGTQMQVSHDRACGIGAVVTARATLIEKADRVFTFQVEAFDEKGPIGSGTHTRVSVLRDRFLAKLNQA